MEMCRVCLTTVKQLLPLDDSFVINYNILTNLNITLFDGMPQYSCVTCLDTVKCFIEFREKSIISETTLREIIYSDVKAEKKTHEIEIDKNPSIYQNDNDLLAIKSEIKEEHEYIDNFDIAFDEDLKNLMIKKDEDDMKPKRIKKKKRKKHKLGKKINEDGLHCGICPKTFEEKNALCNHLDSHKNDRLCILCRKPMNSFSQLLAHRLIHVPLNQSKCHICERKFKSCLYLEHHYRKIHIEGDDRNLSCSCCSIKCDTPKKLSSHMQMHSSKKYFCDICSKGFQSKANLTSHIKLHSVNKAYVCDMCGFSCKHSGGLKDHKIRRHTPKRVYCKQCKRPFVSQEEHDRHKCSFKLIICPVCGLQLNGSSRLSRHMVVHSNIPRYECTRCPAKYKTKTALITHLDRHDGNRTKHCEYCPAKFYSAAVLIKHRRIHTGEKPYVCKVCNKGFTSNHNLKVHMRAHGEYLIARKNIEQEDLTENVTK